MRTIVRLLILLPILFVFIPGCASIEVVQSKHLYDREFEQGMTPMAHIQVANWGYYLFKFIPIISGSLDSPGMGVKMFTHNIRLDTLVDKVMEKSERMGATLVTDLRSTDKSTWLIYLPIFWIREIEVSANLSKPIDPTPQ